MPDAIDEKDEDVAAGIFSIFEVLYIIWIFMLQSINSKKVFLQNFALDQNSKIIQSNFNYNFAFSTQTSAQEKKWTNPITNFLGCVWKILTFVFLALMCCYQSSKSLKQAEKNTNFLFLVKQGLQNHLNKIKSDGVLCSRVIITTSYQDIKGNISTIHLKRGYKAEFLLKALEEAIKPPTDDYINLTGMAVCPIDDIKIELFTYERPKDDLVVIKKYPFQTQRHQGLLKVKPLEDQQLFVETEENPLTPHGRKIIHEKAGIPHKLEDELENLS